ncbi:hypothetical protein SK128_018002, partial [Halocaridina rubra]
MRVFSTVSRLKRMKILPKDSTLPLVYSTEKNEWMRIIATGTMPLPSLHSHLAIVNRRYSIYLRESNRDIL